MTEAALEPRGNESGSHWVRRTLLVTFCVLLLGALGIAFTRVIAARVPEQRATLEKLITERTGLAVRFDNVHFAWSLDGTSAVFERVELTDPARGRVRVVAPELRVEFDSWDYLRHHQFSLGHVTLSSPDIEIIGDPLIPGSVAARARGGKPHRAAHRVVIRLLHEAGQRREPAVHQQLEIADLPHREVPRRVVLRFGLEFLAAIFIGQQVDESAAMGGVERGLKHDL